MRTRHGVLAATACVIGLWAGACHAQQTETLAEVVNPEAPVQPAAGSPVMAARLRHFTDGSGPAAGPAANQRFGTRQVTYQRESVLGGIPGQNSSPETLPPVAASPPAAEPPQAPGNKPMKRWNDGVLSSDGRSAAPPAGPWSYAVGGTPVGGCATGACGPGPCGPNGCPSTMCERMWVKSEVLGWWLNGVSTPALVATSPTNTPRNEAAILGFPDTTVLAGQENLGDQARLGGRLSVGGWIGANRALEGYYLYVGDDDSGDYSFTSVLGDPILGRPFFNTRDQVEDSLLTGFPDEVDGTTTIDSDSQLQSAGLLLRHVLKEGPCGRLDLLTGYRYLQFSDSIVIRDDLVNQDPGGLFQQGSEIDIMDAFYADNQWHGGDVGLAMTVDRGRWSWDVLTKLGIGANMRHSQVSGRTTVTDPGGASATDDAGLLAGYTNSGSTRRRDISLIPELNLNLRYRVTDRFSVGAGYTLLFVTRVLRAGDMIDRNVNPDQFPIFGGGQGFAGPQTPAHQLEDSTLRAHGLSILAELHY